MKVDTHFQFCARLSLAMANVANYLRIKTFLFPVNSVKHHMRMYVGRQVLRRNFVIPDACFCTVTCGHTIL